MTVARADWLVSNQTVERRERVLAGQQTSRHDQVNKLVRYSGGRTGKLVQVDEMTGEGLCLLFWVILSWGDSVRGGGWSGILSEEGRSGEVVSCSYYIVIWYLEGLCPSKLCPSKIEWLCLRLSCPEDFVRDYVQGDFINDFFYSS